MDAHGSNDERAPAELGPWSVSCGCDGHGDHLGCDAGCVDYGCAHPLGVEVTDPNEDAAFARGGVPLDERVLARLRRTGRHVIVTPTDGGHRRPGAAEALVALAPRVATAARLGVAWPPLFGPGPVLVVGAGGSYPAAELIARLARHAGVFASAAKPLDVTGPVPELVAVSYSGTSPDVAEAIRLARRAGCTKVTLITGSLTAPLADAADVVVCHRDGTDAHGDVERGFLSFAATIAPAAAVAACISGAAAPPGAASVSGESLVAGMGPLEVVASGWAWPAALDVESKWTEAALGVVRLHEAKDLSHGRYLSVLAGQHPRVLHLIAGPDTGYDAALSSTLHAHANVTTVRAGHGPLGALGLLSAVAHLAVAAGVAAGVDISRPDFIPSAGTDLYAWQW